MRNHGWDTRATFATLGGDNLKRGSGMSDVERLVREAWERLGRGIMRDSDELQRRLARRRSKMLSRPVRACLTSPSGLPRDPKRTRKGLAFALRPNPSSPQPLTPTRLP